MGVLYFGAGALALTSVMSLACRKAESSYRMRVLLAKGCGWERLLCCGKGGARRVKLCTGRHPMRSQEKMWTICRRRNFDAEHPADACSSRMRRRPCLQVLLQSLSILKLPVSEDLGLEQLFVQGGRCIDFQGPRDCVRLSRMFEDACDSRLLTRQGFKACTTSSL